MARNWAILIGINNYEHSTSLKYAKRDAELMRGFLVKEAKFDQVFFFSDDSPDYAGKSTRPSFTNLKKVLRTMFEKPFMEAGDNFWFFFSGHGMPHDGCDYLMACDSDPGDVKDTAISINYVTERLRRCGADNVVLILDACRGGLGSKSGEGIGNQSAEVAREKGVITFFSCSPNQLSYELDDLQQGAFTKALLEGLGVQGQCATVERLNHYLSGRVPELIRLYKKSDTLRQTPYIIAEPITKYHLILCPKYATLTDVATIKIDALSAQLDQDFDLAEQLYIRVLAASPGDKDAIKGLKKIAIAQHQQTPEDRNKTEKSSQPAPPNPTPIEPDVPIQIFTPIKPDVPLKSSRGIDYTKLRDLLAIGKWKEADEETAKKILEVSRRTSEGGLRHEDIDQFPCEDLRTIDQLWVKYSNGRFGFSVQKRIYQSLGGTKEYDEKIWNAFGDQVGWRVNDLWLDYDHLKFNHQGTQEGHLPILGVWYDRGGLFVYRCVMYGRGLISSLTSRLVKCNI